MTEKEKLLETLKVAYEPRKIPQEDGIVAIYYPTNEEVADMIWATIIDEYKHRAEVAERAFDNTMKVFHEVLSVLFPDIKVDLDKWKKDNLAHAEKELAEVE